MLCIFIHKVIFCYGQGSDNCKFTQLVSEKDRIEFWAVCLHGWHFRVLKRDLKLTSKRGSLVISRAGLSDPKIGTQALFSRGALFPFFPANAAVAEGFPPTSCIMHFKRKIVQPSPH